MGIRALFENLFKRGITIGYSDGKTFDPHGQIRTDAMEDIRKNKEARNGKQMDNIRLDK